MTGEILEATGGTLIIGEEDRRFTGITIDSRTVRGGELFVAIEGERFDGHDFAEDVLQKGAHGIMAREGWSPIKESIFHEAGSQRNLIAVPDTLRGLQDLAHYHRMRYDIPVAAVTGSNGKTSTKEMLYAILQQDRKAYRNPGNLNNHFGVPLSLFGMGPEIEAAVLEFGMSGFGEIRRLRKIARPTVVIITNVSAAHLETLKTLDHVARAKAEILEDLPEDGWAILNDDDPKVNALRESIMGQVMTFGMSNNADVFADDIRIDEKGSRFVLRHGNEKISVHLPVPGRHHIANALAAAAAAHVMGASLDTISQGLASFVSPSMRWEVHTLASGAVVINDAYNANPASMKAALDTVKEMGKERRNIAVLGDMLELGEISEEAHREIGRLVARGPFAFLFTVGERSKWIGEEAEKLGMNPDHIRHVTAWNEAVHAIKEILQGKDRVLLKASRKIGLEGIVEELKR